MHKAVYSRNHFNRALTVPKADVPCAIRHLDTQGTPQEGGETILTSKDNHSRKSHGSSPLTQTPFPSAGHTDADDNIVDIGFPLLDVRRLRIVREPYMEEDTRKVLRGFDP